MKIAITGHRPNKLDNDYDLTSPLIQRIKNEIINTIHINTHVQDDIILITGMALGIDTLFAKIAIELKLPFIAAITCWQQDTVWPNRSRSLYHEILNNPLCTKHIVHEGYYNSQCMQLRNQWMINNCDILIAVWDGTSGGTANCVNYAKSIKREIIVINPNDFK